MEWLMRRIVASPDEPNAFECAIGRSYRLVYFWFMGGFDLYYLSNTI